MGEPTSDLESDIVGMQQLLQSKTETAFKDQVDESDVDTDDTIDTDEELEMQDGTSWSSYTKPPSYLEDSDVFDNESSLESCLRNNQKYQEVLMESIKNLEIELIRNRELQTVLKEKLTQSTAKKNRNTIKWFTFCIPYFKTKAGHIPPPNDETRLKNANKDLLSVTQPCIWSNKEEEMLIEAIKEDAYKVTLTPKIAKCEVLHAETTSGCLSKLELIMKKEELEKAKHELAELKINAKTAELPLRGFACDWMRISISYFDGNRSGTEIELYWKNYLHPSINKKKWSKEELENLKNLVQNMTYCNWDKIANTLATDRTALQCCAKYQSKLNPIHTRIWTPEEKVKLLQEVENNRIGEFIQWRKVAVAMEGRKLRQLWYQYNYIINPNLKKGKWTEEEDLWLVAALWLFGIKNVFWKVKEYIPNRSSRQCLDRWNDVLDFRLQFGNWTEEDDQHLLKLVEEHGKQWAFIKKHFEGRTACMICRRYKRLTKNFRVRNDYNRVHRLEYLGRLYRLLFMCLNRIAKIKRVAGLTALTSTEFQDSFVGRRLSDNNALRRACYQLSVEEFQKYLSPSVFRDKSTKKYNVEQEISAYLSFFKVAPSKGRPIISYNVDQNSSDCYKHINGLESVLRVHPSNSTNGMALLPPMVKNISWFRSLLLLKSKVVTLKRRFDDCADDQQKQELHNLTNSESYQILFQRFASLFFWPAILSVFKPEIVEESYKDRLENSSANKVKNKRSTHGKKVHWKRKRKQTNPLKESDAAEKSQAPCKRQKKVKPDKQPEVSQPRKSSRISSRAR